jgi:hypothetical protein
VNCWTLIRTTNTLFVILNAVCSPCSFPLFLAHIRQTKVLESPSAYKEAILGDSDLTPIKLTHSSIKNAIIQSGKQMKLILKEADLVAEKPALAIDENYKPAFFPSEDFRAIMPVYVGVPNSIALCVGAPNQTILYQPNKQFAYNIVEWNYMTNHSHLGAHYIFSESTGAKMGGRFASNLTGLPTPPKLPTRVDVCLRDGMIRGFSIVYPDPVGVLTVGRAGKATKRGLVMEEGEGVLEVDTISAIFLKVRRLV